MLNMAMYHVIGCDTTVLLAAQAGQLELNVMMPVLAHNLFEMMQVTIGAVQAFTDRCVRGVLANREKAQSWLERNAIIVTALNPLIGYAAGAELVKESLARSQTVFEVARQRLEKGELRHRDGSRSVTEAELEAALGNLRRLTEGGIVG
jgi:fumarate hydratase class II